MSTMLFHQILDLTMQLMLLGLLAGAGRLGMLIVAHVKNHMVATALTSLTNLASQLLSVATSQVYAAVSAGQKPDVFLIKGAFLSSLQTFGTKALETMVAHGGVTKGAVVAALQSIGDSALAELQEALANAQSMASKPVASVPVAS